MPGFLLADATGFTKYRQISEKSAPKSGFTLLQGLTWFSGTQTGCRWLISYIEQKKFLACEPEISLDFSAPPEFSGGEMEKFMNTG
jgi:hypothetical protein